ncbi:hypothetical protein [Methylomagnum sp.]
MIGGVISFVVCIWFYLTADRLKLNPLQWIVGALIVFYGTKAVWTFVILKPLMGATPHGALGAFMMELAGAALGVAACWLFQSKVMLKQGQTDSTGA